MAQKKTKKATKSRKAASAKSPAKGAKTVSRNGRVTARTAASANRGRTRPAASSGKRAPRTAATRAAHPDAAKPNLNVVTPQKYLSAADLEQFRVLLLEKRAEILGDLTSLHTEAMNSAAQGGGDLSTMPIHMADLGTDNFERDMTLGLLESERALLREIDEALDRIKNGAYGHCLATGKPIGKPRLKARPWAKYCYEYMLAQEKGKGFRA